MNPSGVLPAVPTEERRDQHLIPMQRLSARCSKLPARSAVKMPMFLSSLAAINPYIAAIAIAP